MAPEIYQGSGSNSASDIYSLGALAYELLAGRRPFLGDSYDELMYAHINSMPPSLSHLKPEVPRPLAKLAQRALAKRPEDRPSAGEFLDVLSEYLCAPETPEEPRPLLGRHAAAPVAEKAPEPLEEAEAGAKDAKEKAPWWNPFKR
ncbi:protein kinase [Deinococcus lacus]|uniref:non-specific serine/threonine protein kinase n=1 Tax=Deinococcus lacus TaxID=392561 RepID=A0ABW1YCG5_9DEIO